MSEYVFSNNNQDFSYDEHDCLESILEETTKVGDVFKIYRGTPARYKASDLGYGIDDYIVDQAYDKAGEFSESWASSVNWGEFREKLDVFLNNNLPSPDFYAVNNYTPIKIRITRLDDCGFDYEYVDQLEGNTK